MHDPTKPDFRRGEIIGRQTEGKPLTEASKYTRCRCGGCYDVLDFVAVCDHG